MSYALVQQPISTLHIGITNTRTDLDMGVSALSAAMIVH
jgi:hypothetical protein